MARTVTQFTSRRKDITRRLANTWRRLKVGKRLKVVEKGQGLKKGERVKVLGEIAVKSVRVERLDAITADDVRREGFPRMSPRRFVAMYCRHMGCKPSTRVRRIEFTTLWTIADRDVRRRLRRLAAGVAS